MIGSPLATETDEKEGSSESTHAGKTPDDPKNAGRQGKVEEDRGWTEGGISTA